MPSQTAQTRRPTPPPNALVPVDQALTMIEAEYDRRRDEFANLLPDTVDPIRFRALTLRMIAGDANLLKCEGGSLMRAIADVAKTGLEPVLGQVYIVPFWSTTKSSYQATMIIGYEGLKDLVFNSGLVTLIEGDVVREKDEWVFVRGYPDFVLRHVRADGERGPITGAWCLIWLRDAPRPIPGYLSADQITQARKVSKSGTNQQTGAATGIWREWEETMSLKTVLRYTTKFAPKAITSRVRTALDLEDAVDSLLRDQAADVTAPTGRGKSARRARMVRRVTGGGAEEPQGEEVEGESTDLPAQDAPGADGGPSAPPDTGSEGDESAQGAPPTAPPDVEGAARATCGAINQRSGNACNLNADHLEGKNAPRFHLVLDNGIAVDRWPAE